MTKPEFLSVYDVAELLNVEWPVRRSTAHNVNMSVSVNDDGFRQEQAIH